VMQYERTQCPFARGFEVVAELERPKSPPRKTIKRKPSGQAKKWVMDKTWVPQQHGSRPSTSGTDRSETGTTSSYDEDDRSSVCTDSSEIVSAAPEVPLATTTPRPLASKAPPRRLSVGERVSMFQGLRSATAPIKMPRRESVSAMERIVESPLSPPAKQSSEADKPILERQISDAPSLTSSVDSFYSLNTDTPSPKFLDADDDDAINPWANTFPKQEDEPRGRSTHRRQVSEVTVRGPSTERTDPSAPVTPTVPYYSSTTPSIDVRPSSAPSTPPLVSDSDDDSLGRASIDIPTPPDAIRMRKLTGASQRRAFSPMPPAQNLFCPPKHSPRKDFTMP